jgi:hypothetical protein
MRQKIDGRVKKSQHKFNWAFKAGMNIYFNKMIHLHNIFI